MRFTSLVPLLLQDPAVPPAEDGQAPSTGPFDGFWIPLLAIFAIFWFVMILPERKQRKKRQEMLASLSKGDRVMTTSGMLGQIVAVQDDVVTLQAGEGVRLKFTRSAIQSVVEEKGAEEKPAK